ncbi:MAG: 3-hydroxybutyryl-CoA dehydrogenase [Chloroflexi bacterium]|nr:3-hydroxybutyryl-CoA dehydrogenase [Chloroflexota bacterium]
MGGGIAQVCAQAGYETTVTEINDEFLAKGLDRIKSNLAKSVEKGRLSQGQMDETLGRLKGTIHLEDLKDSDLIIEAAIENIEEKRRIFTTLDALCPPTAIFASNTSSLPIIEMAAVTKRRDQFLGIHFFNPAPVMKLVELVRTITTSDETMTVAREFGESVGKTVVISKDTPGFIVNLLLVPYLLDAIRAYETGVATREDIDQAMVLGCGHPMGPLTLADFIGLDTVYYISNIMFDEFKDTRYASPPLLRRMVLAGQHGRKAGKGFYDH